MTRQGETPRCLDAETIAEFAEGRLSRKDIRQVVAHLDTCERCRDLAEAASETILEEGTAVVKAPHVRTWWLAVAAAIVVAILAVPAMRFIVLRRSPIANLAAIAPRDERTVEARFAGGFGWAPYHGPMRANDTTASSARMKLTGAAGELVERADREKSPDLQHAAGVALALAGQNPDDSISRLRSAASASPNDAKAWSDLAAAEYAAALGRGAASQFPVALADADHALRLDGKLAEALFNRALILERLGLYTQARAAWERYLAVDPGSEWSREARERLSKLPTSTGDSQFQRELPRLERAALANDTHTVMEIVTAFPQQARVEGEQQRLGAWGEAGVAGERAGSAGYQVSGVGDQMPGPGSRVPGREPLLPDTRSRRPDTRSSASTQPVAAQARAPASPHTGQEDLTIARAIGGALAAGSGETMLRDSVRAIDGADGPKRALMMQGHALIRQGRALARQQKLADGERAMREAAAKLAAAGDPMALTARFYAASGRLAQNDAAHARPELEALLHEVQTPELGAEVRWDLARCHTFEDDWAAALPLLDEAHAAFARLGERSNAGFIDNIRASVLLALGRLDDSWEARSRAFAALSREGREDRLAAGIDGAAQFELRAGRRATALALLGLEESVPENAVAPAARAAMLVQQSLLNAVLGNPDAALRSAEAADAAARRVSDPAQQARALADAQFATAAVVLDRDPRYARQLLTAAIDTYQAHNLVALIAEPYLLRARAEGRLGDTNAAAGDLEAGISTLERRRIQFAGPVAGTGVLDAGVTLYGDAVRLSLDRGDVAGAFAYAERAHAADVTSSQPASLKELEARLAGSGVAVLELVVLPEEMVAFTITEHGISVTQTKLVKPVFDYDTLIRPSERAIAGARAVVIVPDAPLENIAFAGLFDGRQYLVEKLPVAVAPSAASLHVVPRTAPRSITAIALPSGDASHSVSLPETAAELADVAHVYRQSQIVNENVATPAALRSVADVMHIAGHTERQSGLGDAALVFSGNERASWKTIASTLQPHAKTVVLAACETLRRPNSPQARALSLGGAFLAAGAGNVVGTLAPIADTDARAIFRALHRELAAGVDPAEALRRAQIAAIAAQPSRPESWRAVELLTCNIPQL